MDRNTSTFALVRVNEKNEFAYRLDTLALKKTANKKVFEDMSTKLEKIMLGEGFIEVNRCERCLSKSKKELSPLILKQKG